MRRPSFRLILTGLGLGVLLGVLYSTPRPAGPRSGAGLPWHTHDLHSSSSSSSSSSSASASGVKSRLRQAGQGAGASVVSAVKPRPERMELGHPEPSVVALETPHNSESATTSSTSSTTSSITSSTSASASASSSSSRQEGSPFEMVSSSAAAGGNGEAGRGEAVLPRVCGSPAVDGYAHVKPECLQNSPTNKHWWSTHPHGGKSGEGLECNIEESVSLDGLAVGWGIGNTKSSPEECCQACRDHVPGAHVGGPFGSLPCNVWVFCNAPKCYEADAHEHSQGDCWLKFSEAPQSPEVNARGAFTPEFRRRHPDAPERCQWVSGVLLPPGQRLTNGTFGPRYHW